MLDYYSGELALNTKVFCKIFNKSYSDNARVTFSAKLAECALSGAVESMGDGSSCRSVESTSVKRGIAVTIAPARQRLVLALCEG